MAPGSEKFEATKLGDAVGRGSSGTDGPRAVHRGPTVKGKATYQVRIDNSFAAGAQRSGGTGNRTKTDEQPKELSGICIAPRRNMTVPATEEVVKTLGLRKGIRVVAADLSGL